MNNKRKKYSGSGAKIQYDQVHIFSLQDYQMVYSLQCILFAAAFALNSI